MFASRQIQIKQTVSTSVNNKQEIFSQIRCSRDKINTGKVGHTKAKWVTPNPLICAENSYVLMQTKCTQCTLYVYK